jgi:LysM repeat protein
VEGAIYSQWTDSTHSATILGPDTGLVGAGMAVSGNNVYYTLAVRRLTGNFNYRPPKTNDQPTAPPGQNTYTPNPQPVANLVMTVTPGEDGSLTHVIQYGQTLIDIAKAYGITVNDLYAANKGLNPTRPVYYAGDSLLIRAAFTATSSPTITLTPQPPTKTPTPTCTATRVPPTRTPTRTPTPTPWVSMPEVKIPEENRSGIAYGLILISVCGLTFVIIRGFIQKDR